MNYNKTNNIIGWVVCAIACMVYISTAEATSSLWDCGEFISSCFKVQVPHSPGAPLFVLIGRFFIVLFGNDPLMAAKAVNLMSALCSGFTILFLFWTITYFAKRLVYTQVAQPITKNQIWLIMGAGIVGALAYTFSDSFWYSAVEGEVYAMSSLFTAIVFWAILKWANISEKPSADRWIVFIFFMLGLSIGVHLLNLLTIPSIVMVYYCQKWKKFNYPAIKKYFIRLSIWAGILGFIGALLVANSEATAAAPMDATMAFLVILGVGGMIGGFYLVEYLSKTNKVFYGGMYIIFILGCVITGFIQVGVIQYTIKTAAWFDRIFVNSFNLPFFVGFAFFFILTAFLIWLGLRYAEKKHWYYLRLSLWSFAFMLLGYSSYLTTMIRSNADVAVDMYNVDNPLSLIGYLSREQYGELPLIYGSTFDARPVDSKETSVQYQKSGDKYIETGKGFKYIYAPEDKMIFPRIWDGSNEQGHQDYYAAMLGFNKNQDGSFDREPTQMDNLQFFLGYQANFMYWRYFMWNFSGRQNDLQGTYLSNVRDGNWLTGIPFIDNLRLGSQDKLPDSLKHNKAHNVFFALPFLLGILGLVYQFKRKREDFLVNFLLFFFTGLAIGIYTNMAGNQPRERDYAFVGSFYAFAIWIGLGVLMIYQWLTKIIPSKITATALATLLCLVAVPVLMAQQGWDDHDRSKKTIARDVARNYLESCEKDAILFCYGDNDTYPLWYVQEVEGVRPDIRIINTSLLGIDWYINQLRYKINESKPIDVIWTKEQIEGRKRDYVVYKPNANFPQNTYYDLFDLMKNYIGSNNPAFMEQTQGMDLHSYPIKNVFVPIPPNFAKSPGTAAPADSTIVSEMKFTIPKNALLKNDLIILNIIAANNWKRPIYFTTNSPYQVNLGFEKYLKLEGISYKLVPIENKSSNLADTDKMLHALLTNFGNGNAQLPNVYFDEENRKQLLNIREVYVDLAQDLIQKNRKEDARKVLRRIDSSMHESTIRYGQVSRANSHNRVSLRLLDAAISAEDVELATKIYNSLNKDITQQQAYYHSLSKNSTDKAAFDKLLQEYFLRLSMAKTREDQYKAEEMLANNLSGNQPTFIYDIKVNYSLYLELQQLEVALKKLQGANPQSNPK